MATASNIRDPFTGKPKSGEGGGGFEIPSEDVHKARIVALIDLGTHEESFQGGPAKMQRKVYLAFELDEQMSASKFNHVVGKEYTLSFHEKASLRKLAESLLNEGASFGNGDRDIDYKSLLGQPCTVQIKHAKSDDGAKTYSNIGVIGPVSKKERASVFKPGRQPLCWFLGQELEDIPDWLPRIFGEEVKEKIKRSREWSAGPTADDSEGDVSDDDTPF